MNKKQIVGLTNFLCIAGALLLVYWVFSFSLTIVFGLKVFKENLTQLFGMSIFGILAVVGGALILNIALNLTRIAESSESQVAENNRSWSTVLPLLLLPFPLIAAFLFYGDLKTTQRKEEYLLRSAQHLVESNEKGMSYLADFAFHRAYVTKVGEILKVMSGEDENFPSVSLIVADSIDDKGVFLSFGEYSGWEVHEEKYRADFIFGCSKEEREYLRSVFFDGNDKARFSSADSRYELYLPANVNGKTIVLYFSEYSRYGKYGS